MIDWNNAPPIAEEEKHINPPHLQRLNYNSDYYTILEEDLKIGDDVVIGRYASDAHGSPNIRWTEVKIIELPLKYPFITIKKKKNVDN